MAHSQTCNAKHLPSLTDFGKSKEESKIISFLEQVVFASVK